MPISFINKNNMESTSFNIIDGSNLKLKNKSNHINYDAFNSVDHKNKYCKCKKSKKEVFSEVKLCRGKYFDNFIGNIETKIKGLSEKKRRIHIGGGDHSLRTGDSFRDANTYKEYAQRFLGGKKGGCMQICVHNIDVYNLFKENSEGRSFNDFHKYKLNSVDVSKVYDAKGKAYVAIRDSVNKFDKALKGEEKTFKGYIDITKNIRRSAFNAYFKAIYPDTKVVSELPSRKISSDSKFLINKSLKLRQKSFDASGLTEDGISHIIDIFEKMSANRGIQISFETNARRNIGRDDNFSHGVFLYIDENYNAQVYQARRHTTDPKTGIEKVYQLDPKGTHFRSNIRRLLNDIYAGFREEMQPSVMLAEEGAVKARRAVVAAASAVNAGEESIAAKAAARVAVKAITSNQTEEEVTQAAEGRVGGETVDAIIDKLLVDLFVSIWVL